jgi:hypothetical protein
MPNPCPPSFELIAGARRDLEEQSLAACFEDPQAFERLLRMLTPASNTNLAMASAPQTPPTVPDIAP